MKSEKINEKTIKLTITKEDIDAQPGLYDDIKNVTSNGRRYIMDLINMTAKKFFDTSIASVSINVQGNHQSEIIVMLEINPVNVPTPETINSDDAYFGEENEYEIIDDNYIMRKENRSVVFIFNDFSTVEKYAKILKSYYIGKSSLYTNKGVYKLLISNECYTDENFEKICNTFREYATLSYKTEDYIYAKEHGDVIIEDDALTVLESL